MQKDTEKLEQNTSWEKKFEKAKGTFEVYGEFGMGIDYKKLKEAFSKAITTAVAKRDAEAKELSEALIDMYNQYCSHGHDFMSAGEGASSVLERYGYADFDEVGRMKILKHKSI